MPAPTTDDVETAEALETPDAADAALEADAQDEAPAAEHGSDGAVPDTGEDAASDAIGNETAAPDLDAGGDGAAELVFALADRPTPQDTAALLDWLRAAPAEATLVFDCEGVEATCTPYVLALAAASRARAEAGAQAAIANPAPAIVDAFSDLGLFQDLMKMEFRP